MTVLQIIEEILALAPAGIQLTAELLALITSIEKAFTVSDPVAQKQVVSNLAKYLSIKK